MDDKLVFTSLSPADLRSDKSWWEIYDEAFPRAEREPPDAILKSLQMGVGLATVARSNNETIAIATTHLLKEPPAVFLVYLATSKRLRGRGSGGELLEYTWQAGQEKLSASGPGALGLIAEVDSPDEAESPEERHVRERRIGFFSRHGAELLPHPYTQPPVDGVTTVRMRLIFRPAAGQGQPDLMLTQALVRAIYFEKYHAVNGIARNSLVSLLGAS